MPDFIPRPDAHAVQWANHFAATLCADPAAFHIPPERAATFKLLADDFAAAYQLTTTNDGRTPSSIYRKDAARAAMSMTVRLLAKCLRSNPNLTEAQLLSVGLKPISRNRRPYGRPASPPRLYVLRTRREQVKVRLRSIESPTRSAKPRGIGSATILRFIGDEPSASLADWQLAGHTSRTTTELKLPRDLAPGTKVWHIAQWNSTSGVGGPMSERVMTWIPFAGSVAA
jgi:hypothetical protein